VQVAGYAMYAGGMIALAVLLAVGAPSVGTLWAGVLMAIAGYLAADLVSGMVHFLADNFGSPDTPFLGPGFVLPFRQHHHDPTGITRANFFEANGNNALVCLPVLLPVLFLLPVRTSAVGHAFGVFFFVLLLAAFLTNQTHKWAHMETVPRPVRWLQDRGLILGKAHHDVHHTSPFDTYYCITVGFWNPLFERFGVFTKLERLLRRWVPGTDPVVRVEREAAARARGLTLATKDAE
jgi:hypothetical protein